MTHSTEATGQHVQDEASEEFGRGQPEGLLLAAMGVVTPAQANNSVAMAEQAIVGQRDTVGIASKVFQYLSRSSKRFLRIHDPVLSPQIPAADLGLEFGVVVQRVPQSIEVLAAKDPREGADRKEIAT